MLNIHFCKKNRDTEMTEYYKNITQALDLKESFNPSFYIDDTKKIMAFRGRKKKGGENISFVSIESDSSKKIINISKTYSQQLDELQLIDPKVVKLQDDVYITFHSGHQEKGNNIYLMKVFPYIEAPKKVMYKNRNTQERNWAFFSENNELYALYWINPLKILRLKQETETTLVFEDFYNAPHTNEDMPTDLTLGTQLCKSNGLYYGICHKKIYIRHKKLYVGKPYTFDFTEKRISLGKRWLTHSLFSMLDIRRKENTNLFSCTYFSGLQIYENSTLLGYGVNDTYLRLSKYNTEKLFYTK